MSGEFDKITPTINKAAPLEIVYEENNNQQIQEDQPGTPRSASPIIEATIEEAPLIKRDITRISDIPAEEIPEIEWAMKISNDALENGQVLQTLAAYAKIYLESVNAIKRAAQTREEKFIRQYANLLTIPHITTTLSSILRELSFEYNRIVAFPTFLGAFRDLLSLTMQHNLIREIPSDISNLISLRSLNLNYNTLTALSNEIGELKNLEGLYVMYNRLKTLPETIVHCQKLKGIYAAHNEIESIPSLAGLDQLEVLNLGENQLESIPGDVVPLPKLHTLHVNDNKLTNLFVRTGDAAIAHLSIHHNRIKSPGFLYELPKLKQVNISYNPVAENIAQEEDNLFKRCENLDEIIASTENNSVVLKRK